MFRFSPNSDYGFLNLMRDQFPMITTEHFLFVRALLRIVDRSDELNVVDSLDSFHNS